MQLDVSQAGREHSILAAPVLLRVTGPSIITPARNIARSSLSTWRSEIRSSIVAINPECGIASKRLAMSDSATHRLPLQASSMRTWRASCAERLGRNPNDPPRRRAALRTER